MYIDCDVSIQITSMILFQYLLNKSKLREHHCLDSLSNHNWTCALQLFTEVPHFPRQAVYLPEVRLIRVLRYDNDTQNVYRGS